MTTTPPCFGAERLRSGVLLALLALLGGFAPDVGARYARSLLVDLGPNDFDYARGFREDWERDGDTRFHWTSPVASLTFPYALSGEGFRLRARVRRHLVEPAEVIVTAAGRTFHVFSIEADRKLPYRVETAALPPLQASGPFLLGIHSVSENPRPLGVAVDWIEIAREGASARFRPPAAMRWRTLALLVAALGVPWWLGATRIAVAHGLALFLGIAVGTALHPIAAERILREGAWVYACVGLGVLLGLALARRRASTGVTPVLAAGLAVIVLVGLAVRLAMVLHPQYFYPDVRVHAVFARAFAREGFVDFMSGFTANQFRYSLGLQFEGGHWYAFPYPPAFYLIAGSLVRWLALVPEVAVSVVAAALNASSALLAFGIGRRLGLSPRTALAAAAAVPLLPLFTTRLTLAYFPALAGQCADALVILYLLARRRDLDRPRVVVTLAALVALALLTYTQSVVNLGLLLAAFLVLQLSVERKAWRRHAGLALAGAVGALLAFGLFYARYVPVFLDMRRGVPMAGESIVLDRIAQQERARVAADEEPETASDDPFAGPGFDLLRGVRKAAWRLWLFYGVFAIPVFVGFLLLVRGTDGEIARFALAWGAVFVLLNLGSASLPGPNLLRYNKDLEIVAPLFCACLALAGERLTRRGRFLGIAYAGVFVVWSLTRALVAFEDRVFLAGR